MSGSSSEAVATPAANRSPVTASMLLAAVGVTALVVGVGAWWLRPAPAVPARVIRTTIPFPPGVMGRSSETFEGFVAISSTHVAFVAGPMRQLYLRGLDQPEAIAVSGATGAAMPFFSPNGEWIGFFSRNRLKKMPVGGGPISELCDVGDPTGATWGPNDTIVFGDLEKGILTAPAAGGTPRVVAKSDSDNLLVEPTWLPGGSAIAYSVVTRIGRFDSDITTAKLHLLPIAAGATATPLTDGYRARFATSGYLTIMRGSALVGMPFDAGTKSVSGAADTLVADVARSGYDISEDGSLAYLPATLEAPKTFVWLNRQGQVEPTGMPAKAYAYPRISHDGSRIVVDARQDERDLWIWNIPQKTLTRLTSERGQDAYALWTADSRQIIYGAPTTGAEENLAMRSADGTGAIDNLHASDRHQTPYSLSPDGAWLVFRDEVDGEGTNLGLLQMKDRQAKPLIATRFNERNAEISPDGALMAYQSDEGGTTEIFVRPFPNVDAGKQQVSSGGGIRPVWSRNGRELFYLAEVGGSTVIKRVERRAGQAPDFTPPVTLLDVSEFYFGTFLGRTFDVAADGRFLVQRIESKIDASGPPGLSLVLNWVAELKK
jgi:serine/threonine-protein kinase